MSDEGEARVSVFATIESDPDAPEGNKNVVVEASLTWASDVLARTHTRVATSQGLLRLADLSLPLSVDRNLIVVHCTRHGAFLVSPHGKRVPTGNRMQLKLGRATLDLALRPDDEAPAQRAESDGRVVRGVALGAVIHASLLAIAFLGRAPAWEEEDHSRDALRAYMAAIDSRFYAKESEQLALAQQGDVAVPRETTTKDAAASARHDQGAAGNPTRTNSNGAVLRTKGAQRHVGKRPGGSEVDTFGMIALLTGDKSVNGESGSGSSPFADADGPSAMGNIFGTTIDDAAGFGGFGLSGSGEGGGGLSHQVPLAGIGTGSGFGNGCGADCSGTSTGRGAMSRGLTLHGSHRMVDIYLRCAPSDDPKRTPCSTQVNGRLPPEAVQRIVRQNFGRLRACYESGLQRNPQLEGRIATKFVIDRAGAVTMVSVDERSLADNDVAQCVARAFYSMTFPQPEGGIVTVVYPVIFGTN